MDKSNLKHIPNAPGVYIFKDKRGNIIYIGKARSLKERVRHYFSQPQSFKIQIMVSKIDDVDYILTKTETQARLEEAELIKENLPPYNTVFRDDKSFPLICISNEAFPIVWVARHTSRRLKNLVSRYFGPYTNAGLLREALKTIRHIFGFRSCFKMPKKPCLYYRLKLCPGPCIGKISVKEYREIIKNIVLFLEGRQEELICRLSFKMHKLADEKKFEEAAQVRNQVQALSSISQEGMSSLSDFTQPIFKFMAFFQKYLSSILSAEALMLNPKFPTEEFGASFPYQSLKPERLPPMVPKALNRQPGRASI